MRVCLGRRTVVGGAVCARSGEPLRTVCVGLRNVELRELLRIIYRREKGRERGDARFAGARAHHPGRRSLIYTLLCTIETHYVQRCVQMMSN